MGNGQGHAGNEKRILHLLKACICLLLLILALSPGAQAQSDSVHIRFALTYQDAPLELGHPYAMPQQDSLRIETLRFYVSQIQLVQGAKVVAGARPAHRLVDAEEPASQVFAISVPQGFAADRLAFLLGVDSLTQAAGAMGDDLDPTQGMYWAWQSGYINFKLEGKTPRCPARNHTFQFHLGGFLAPFESAQSVEIPLEKGQQEIVIAFAVDRFLGLVDLQETNEVMRPCAKAVELAQGAAGLFMLAK